MLDYEKRFYSDDVRFIVGVDEAGRGPLAGPVVAAAVVFPPDYVNDAINDSKQLTEKKREALYQEVIDNALGYGIAFVSAEEIDALNIYAATQKAMREAISQIKCDYQLILTDAMKMEGFDVPLIPIIKGDAKALNIAGASILAKVTRDRYMNQLQEQYPNFSFSVHKGYGTAKHLEELEKYGPIKKIHRKSFKPVAKFFQEQLTLF